MKRLSAYDFDGTLINTESPETGKSMWEKYYNKPYPHKGWWGRRESLDTNVFENKPFPEILKRLKKDREAEDTHVIILTSRLEKLRSELENILSLNNSQVDELVTKRGAEDKGDIILEYVQNNPDLEEISIYDDFADGQEHKIAELIKIKEILPDNIQYNIYYVQDGNFRLMESNNHLKEIIVEEIIKMKS